MKRVYYPYNLWEEVKYGMYRTDLTELQKTQAMDEAVYLLSNPKRLKEYMMMTLDHFPKSTERNLTTSGRNKQAWLGQAACCLYAKVPEDLTKIAWSTLTDEQRVAANLVADEVYAEWVKLYV